MPEYDPKQPSPRGTRDLLLAEGAVKFSQWLRKHKPLMVTDTTLRDAHQSLFAARMRTYDMLIVADFISRRLPNLFSLEMWGCYPDTCTRFLGESPYERLRKFVNVSQYTFPNATPWIQWGRVCQLP